MILGQNIRGSCAKKVSKKEEGYKDFQSLQLDLYYSSCTRKKKISGADHGTSIPKFRSAYSVYLRTKETVAQFLVSHIFLHKGGQSQTH